MNKLPLDSAERKKVPLWTFIAEYFPDAFIAMASLSYRANEKHNPGQPMHWSRAKSGDHKDCILRHLLDEERIDPETGQPEAVAAAWRACANAQLVIERLREAPYDSRQYDHEASVALTKALGEIVALDRKYSSIPDYLHVPNAFPAGACCHGGPRWPECDRCERDPS